MARFREELSPRDLLARFDMAAVPHAPAVLDSAAWDFLGISPENAGAETARQTRRGLC